MATQITSQVEVSLRAHKVCPKSCWIARLTLEGAKLTRDFVSADRDSTSKAGTGEKHWSLGEGVYESDQVLSSTRGETIRQYFEIRDGVRRSFADQTVARVALGYVVPAVDVALPDLVGSPKQIAWAETIRATKIAALAGQEVATLVAKDSAKYWIDSRGTSAWTLLRESKPEPEPENPTSVPPSPEEVFDEEVEVELRRLALDDLDTEVLRSTVEDVALHNGPPNFSGELDPRYGAAVLSCLRSFPAGTDSEVLDTAVRGIYLPGEDRG